MTIAVYAVVNNGVVVNMVNWDGNTSDWEPPAGTTAAPVPSGQAVDLGWTYSNGIFAPAP